MEKTKKNRIKKVILAALAVAAVACITSSMTFAYLADRKEKTNVFKGSPDITAVLFEENWDGSTKDTKGAPDNDKLIGNKTVEGTDSEPYGINEAKHYSNDGSGNSRILKNPKMANTSQYDEYVAMKLTYKVKLNDDNHYQEVTKEEFENLVSFYYDNGIGNTEIDVAKGMNSKWVMVGEENENKAKTSTVYVYKDKLDANTGITEELFSYIVVNNAVVPGQDFCLTHGKVVSFDDQHNDQASPGERHTKINLLSDGYTMPAFEIEITGAVVKADDYKNATGGDDSVVTAALVNVFENA